MIKLKMFICVLLMVITIIGLNVYYPGYDAFSFICGETLIFTIFMMFIHGE